MSFEGEQEHGRPPLIDLAELAARWKLAEKEVIEMVRHRGVPFLRLGHSVSRVNWQKVRFSLPAIEAWERASQERFRGGPPVVPPPAPMASAGKGEGRSKTRLGTWREPSVG